MTRHRLILAVPIVVLLLVAGCGSSSTSSSAAGGQTAAAAGSTSSAAPVAGPYGSVRASSSSSTASSQSVALITTKQARLGTVLALGPKRMTVYMFESDTPTGSTCSGACASVWPPVTGKPSASGGAVGSDLGTIRRSDGSTQVTYKGHPLYRFVRDKDDGDVYGQAIKSFGSAWYVLKPSGAKIDES